MGGVDVIAFGFTDKRVQNGAGVFAFANQHFQSVNQGVLVSTVQRVTSLESDHSIPAFFFDQLAGFAGGQNVLTESFAFRLGQGTQGAAQQMGFVGIAFQNHVGARVIGPFGAVHRFQIVHFVPLENIADVESGNNFTVRVGQSHFLSGRQLAGQFGSDREGNWNGPGVFFAVVLDHSFVENTIVGGAVHWTGQRAERSVSNTIDAGKVGSRHWNFRQRSGFCQKLLFFSSGNCATDGFGKTTMGSNELTHIGWNCFPFAGIEG